MIIVDAHCDTITRIMEEETGLYSNKCHVDIQRMQSKGSYLQFFAAFISPTYTQAYSMRRAVDILDRAMSYMEKNSQHIALCLNYNDIMDAFQNNKCAAMLSIEDGVAMQGGLSALRMFYKLGVRSICLTWNHRNEIADGVSDGSSGGGLTPFGHEVVKEMNRLGMLVDVSHISEKGFWDVIETSKSPIIASHSNARSVCAHQRNLTNKQILAIMINGGVIGINLYPCFLNDSGEASLKDVIKHIEHIISLTGIEHIGLGADFDGIECTPVDIIGVQDIDKIFNGLLRLNYSEEAVKMLAGGNFLRVIKEAVR